MLRHLLRTVSCSLLKTSKICHLVSRNLGPSLPVHTTPVEFQSCEPVSVNCDTLQSLYPSFWYAFFTSAANQPPLRRWSVGSVLFLASWAFLMGPYQYAVHLISGTRLPFTAAYFGSIAMTIYFAVGVRHKLFPDGQFPPILS